MDEDRFERLKAAIERHAEKYTATPELAKQWLVDIGLYYENGELHHNYRSDKPSFEVDERGNPKVL